MKSSQQRIEQSKHYLSSLGSIDVRTQFGGYSLSVDKLVFAVVAEGELYLRACEQWQVYIDDHQLLPLTFYKCGLPVNLNYYQVDATLWCNPAELQRFSFFALESARRQSVLKKQNMRLKDLPNMGVRMERLLRQVGICSIQMLHQQGAKNCWLKLKAANQHLGLNILYALQGAISGHHQAVLPAEVKEELREWFCFAAQCNKTERKN